MRTNGQPRRPQQSGDRAGDGTTGVRGRLRALAGATLEWVRDGFGFVRSALRTERGGPPDSADTGTGTSTRTGTRASATGSEADARIGSDAAVVDRPGGEAGRKRRRNRDRSGELKPALPGDDLRARERDHQLRIYEPEARDAYVESDTWQEIER